MSLFPVNPTVGTEAEVAGSTFEWDGVKWIKTESDISGGNASIVSGDTPPLDAEPGDVWFNTSNLELYIYYSDVDGAQWVQATSDQVVIDSISNDILPTVDNQFSVGSLARRWSSGFFNELYVGNQQITSDLTTAATGVINTSDLLPQDAAIGQIYVITSEQAVKIWTGAAWINLVGGGSVPSISEVITGSGENYTGESDVVFQIVGSNFNPDATISVQTQQNLSLTPNFIQVTSPTNAEFAFSREFTADEGPLSVILTNPDGLAASAINAIQTGLKPQWVGPTVVFSVLSDRAVNISIRTNAFISDDNSITDFSFKVYTDGTYTEEKVDRTVASGLTLSADGLISGTSPNVTSDATFNFYVGIIDGVGNETNTMLSFKVLASAAIETAGANFIPSATPAIPNIDFIGSVLADFTVIESPAKGTTLRSMIDLFLSNGDYQEGGYQSVPLLRNGDTGWFQDKTCRFLSEDSNGNQAVIAFEESGATNSYGVNAGAIGLSDRPASNFDGAKSVVMWGYNNVDGWQPLWHYIEAPLYDLTSAETPDLLIDGGKLAYPGWTQTGFNGYFARETITVTTAESEEVDVQARIVTGNGATGYNILISAPSSQYDFEYLNRAEVEPYAAAGNFGASNELAEMIVPSGQLAVIDTGFNSSNLLNLPDGLVLDVSSEDFVDGLSRPSFALRVLTSNGISFSPTNFVTTNTFGPIEDSLFNQHFRINYFVNWYYNIPAQTSSTVVEQYYTVGGLGKQSAYDTMPVDYIGFAVYT